MYSQPCPHWRGGWLVERDGGSGLALSPRWGHHSPDIWFFQQAPALAAVQQHVVTLLEGSSPPHPCWAGMRCQGMIGKSERDSSPPPHSGCECQANFISPATPLSPEPLGRLPFADALVGWCCALPGSGCLPAQPCCPGR